MISLYAHGMSTLNTVYPFVFMDCIHYKVREDGRILRRAAYIVLGVTVDGHKEILSITVGVNESSKFWLGMLNDLKNRGVKDVLFFCVDGLAGFKEAIGAVYPQAQIQRYRNWDQVLNQLTVLYGERLTEYL